MPVSIDVQVQSGFPRDEGDVVLFVYVFWMYMSEWLEDRIDKAIHSCSESILPWVSYARPIRLDRAPHM